MTHKLHSLVLLMLWLVVSAVAGAATDSAIQGYWLVQADGGVDGLGSPGFHGGVTNPAGKIAGIIATPDSNGYWLVSSKGVVYPLGDAAPCGDLSGEAVSSPIVGMQATPDGGGYWLVSAVGGIFPFGNAKSYGSLAADHLGSPIVGMQATPDGKGYWLVSAAGGIFRFGDAHLHGSITAHLSSPIVGMRATSNGKGYWLAAANGGVFAFGNAHFHGSATTALPTIAIISTPDNGGYWLVESNGTVLTFGNAPFRGSGITSTSPTVGMAASIKPGTVPSNDISISNSGFAKSPQGGYLATITITNISSSTISGPLSLALTGLPSGVKVTNFGGYYDASPYITVVNPVDLAPAKQVTLTVHAIDPSATPISFTPVVYSGL